MNQYLLLETLDLETHPKTLPKVHQQLLLQKIDYNFGIEERDRVLHMLLLLQEGKNLLFSNQKVPYHSFCNFSFSIHHLLSNANSGLKQLWRY